MRGKVTRKVLDEAENLKGKSLSYGEIARRLGLSPMTIYNYIQKKGKPRFRESLKRS